MSTLGVSTLSKCRFSSHFVRTIRSLASKRPLERKEGIGGAERSEKNQPMTIVHNFASFIFSFFLIEILHPSRQFLLTNLGCRLFLSQLVTRVAALGLETSTISAWRLLFGGPAVRAVRHHLLRILTAAWALQRLKNVEKFGLAKPLNPC